MGAARTLPSDLLRPYFRKGGGRYGDAAWAWEREGGRPVARLCPRTRDELRSFEDNGSCAGRPKDPDTRGSGPPARRSGCRGPAAQHIRWLGRPPPLGCLLRRSDGDNRAGYFCATLTHRGLGPTAEILAVRRSAIGGNPEMPNWRDEQVAMTWRAAPPAW